MSSVTWNNVQNKKALNDNDLTFTTREEVIPIPVLTHEQSQRIPVYRDDELMTYND